MNKDHRATPQTERGDVVQMEQEERIALGIFEVQFEGRYVWVLVLRRSRVFSNVCANFISDVPVPVAPGLCT